MEIELSGDPSITQGRSESKLDEVTFEVAIFNASLFFGT
jgi:hypothetical protein